MEKIRIAAVQMNSGADKEANLRAAEGLIDQAAEWRPRIIALPEYFNFLGPSEAHEVNAEPIPGSTIERLAERARKHGVYLHCGSLLERSARPGKFYNTSVVLNPQGDIVAHYRKIHLFDVEVAGHVSAQESSTIEPGDEIVTLDLDSVRFGLSICYDLRFPELYRILALLGAKVLFVPAAFTMFTGKDHWEVLLRARAIENQAFVVAPAQVGKHPPNGVSYGRSMIVDPWGLLLAQAGDSPDVIVSDLSLEALARVRRDVPSLRNRRPSSYRWPQVDGSPAGSATHGE